MHSCKCAFENKNRIPKKQKLSKFHYGTSYLFLLIKTTNTLDISNLQLPNLSKTIKILVASNSKGAGSSVTPVAKSKMADQPEIEQETRGRRAKRPHGIPLAPGGPEDWAWTGLHPRRSSEWTWSDGSWVYDIRKFSTLPQQYLCTPKTLQGLYV